MMTDKKPGLSEQILECSAEHMTLADWGRAINEWADRAAALEAERDTWKTACDETAVSLLKAIAERDKLAAHVIDAEKEYQELAAGCRQLVPQAGRIAENERLRQRFEIESQAIGLSEDQWRGEAIELFGYLRDAIKGGSDDE